MRRIYPSFSLIFWLILFAHQGLSQMAVGGQDTLYGNEWISPGQSYYKFRIGEDGVYRIPASALTAAGIPVGQIAGNRYQLFRLGAETPLYVSSGEAPLRAEDFLEFYVRKNRGELDRFLYADPGREMLNPEYSMYTDSSTCFLTWTTALSPTLRYQDAPNEAPAVLPARENWFWDTLTFVYPNAHMKRRLDGQNLVTYSTFDEGEGFGRAFAREHTIDIQPRELFVHTEPAQLFLSIFSGPGTHQLSISINGAEIFTDTLLGPYQLLQLELPLSLNNPGAPLRLLVRDLTGRNLSIGYIRLRYPRRYAFPGERFAEIQALPGQQPAYYELESFNHGGQAPWVLGLNSLTRLRARLQNNRPAWNAMPDNFLVFTPSEVRNINALQPVSWIAAQDFQAQYLIITHPRLMDAAREYAAYRSSPAGGRYTVSLLNIEQLTDQFAYGVEGHPMALKNMANWVSRQPARPNFLLLIGKGIAYPTARLNPQLTNLPNFIPGFGLVPSDNLLLSKGQSAVPLFAMGRIAASNMEDIRVFLQKVRTYEASFNLPRTFENHAWRKRGVHLVGGNPGEQPIFQSYLDQAGRIITQNGLGASLSTIKKTSTDPVPVGPTEKALDALNQGAIFKTFLGHGAVTVTDFGLDDPSFLNNAARLPLAFSLGCLSGNIFTRERSVSERYLLDNPNGSVSYIASGAYAYPFALANLLRTFYDLAGTALYGKSTGEIIQELNQRFDTYQDFPHKTLIQQFIFHGDPALVLHRGALPDFTIDPQSLRVAPSSINSATDSLTLAFTIGNLGWVRPDSLQFVVEHQLPSGIVFRDTFWTATSNSFHDIVVRLPLRGTDKQGINKLFIRLDPQNFQQEGPGPEAKANNEYLDSNGDKGYVFFINDNEAIPLDPPDMGLSGATEPELIAFTSNIFASEANYWFEIDTSAAFSSPAKMRHKVTANGGLLFWKPAIAWKDQTVYFWRVSMDSSQTESGAYPWRTSSFRYSKDSLFAWIQSQGSQFAGNDLDFLEWDSKTFRLRFVPSPTSIIAEANVRSSTNDIRTRLLVNNDRVINVITTPSLTVGVFNDLSGKITHNISFPLSTPQQRFNFMRFIRDSIPFGAYAFVLSFRFEGQTYFENQWLGDSTLYNRTIFSALEAEGAQSVREILNFGPVPYLFAFRKGYGPIGEEIGAPGEERVTIYFEIPSLAPRGMMRSPLIGPARKWENFTWEIREAALQPGDTAWVQLYGIPSGKQGRVLLRESNARIVGLEDIDAQTYPFIVAEYLVSDPVRFSPAPLEYWAARFEPAEELALDPVSFPRDTLLQGDSIRLNLRLYNLGKATAQAPQLRHTLIASDNATQQATLNFPNVQSRNFQELELSLSTRTLPAGRTRLILETNPATARNEREPLNSQGQLPFAIRRDQTPPLLDVTADGQRLMDGGLVSPSPEFRVLLRDENPFLLLRDTQLLAIQIQYPNRVWKTVGAEDRLQVFPAANGVKNQMEIAFQPRFEQEGEYQLRVRGRDVSGNISGRLDYQVRFRVVLRQSLSQLLPYPNPFSSSTRFLYTFTGSSQPTHFLLRIMTVSGRIVREVRQEEFGPLKVGTHLSDFVWDGTDQFGERLANGVYVYQVLTQDEQGSAMETFETAADSFFRKGFGKIVLLR